MDKIADSVAVLLADLPSHKDSVRVLLNQEVCSHSSAPRVYAALSRANGVPQLPPAIRATVWIENLREPKARDLFDSLNARDGLATVAVEYPDITRRCQDVLSTSYVECQGRTVLTGAMRTVMSYLHATQGPQQLALYRCLIPLVYVLGPTVDGPAKVVCARARLIVGDCLTSLTLVLVRRWRRLLRFSNSPGRDCHLEYVGFKTVVCAPVSVDDSHSHDARHRFPACTVRSYLAQRYGALRAGVHRPLEAGRSAGAAPHVDAVRRRCGVPRA